MEAIFFLLQMGSGESDEQENASLLKWTETIIEAFFLQLTVFGVSDGNNSNSDELDYAADLIERIQRKVEQK